MRCAAGDGLARRAGRRRRGGSGLAGSPAGPGAPAAISPGLAPRPKRVTAIAAFMSWSASATCVPPCACPSSPSCHPKAAQCGPGRYGSYSSLARGFHEPGDKPRRFYAAVSVAPMNGGFTVLLDARGLRGPKGAPADPADPGAGRAGGRGVGGAGRDPGAGGACTPRGWPTPPSNPCRRPARPPPRRSPTTRPPTCSATSPPSPAGLLERQQRLWGPVLDRAEAEAGLRFVRAAGIVHQAQPPETLARVKALALELDDFGLTGLAFGAALFGSAVLAIALQRGWLCGRGGLRPLAPRRGLAGGEVGHRRRGRRAHRAPARRGRDAGALVRGAGRPPSRRPAARRSSNCEPMMRVAFAGLPLQAGAVEDGHQAAGIVDHAALLERAGRQADGRALHAGHHRHVVLGQREGLRAHPVLGHQQPARRAGRARHGRRCRPRPVRPARRWRAHAAGSDAPAPGSAACARGTGRPAPASRRRRSGRRPGPWPGGR